MDMRAEVVFLIGRILFGGFFLNAGIRHFTKLKMMAGYTASKKVPAPGLAVVVTGIMLALGGLSIILGYEPRIGALLLAIFLLVVSFTIHNFWSVSDPQQRMGEMAQFMKNIALLGASLMIHVGAFHWPLSLR